MIKTSMDREKDMINSCLQKI